MHLFRRNKNAGAPIIADRRNSVEISVGLDGQPSLAGVDVQLTGQEIEARIDQHAARLTALSNQLSAPNPEDPVFKRFKNAIENVQKDKQAKKYPASFLNIAEAYEAYALINGQPVINTMTAWDLAWNVLNREALETVLAVSRGQKDSFANSYADLLFARANHCLRQMKYTDDTRTHNAYAQAAIGVLFSYLLQVQKFGIEHWEIHDAVKAIHVAKKYGNVSDEQVKAIIAEVLARPGEGSSAPLMDRVVEKVNSFTLPAADHERLKQMIY